MEHSPVGFIKNTTPAQSGLSSEIQQIGSEDETALSRMLATTRPATPGSRIARFVDQAKAWANLTSGMTVEGEESYISIVILAEARIEKVSAPTQPIEAVETQHSLQAVRGDA